MAICGNCHEHHETVQEIKNCYGRRTDIPREQNPLAATKPMLKYIGILLSECEMSPLEDENISKDEAHELIEYLKKVKALMRTADPAWTSADGDPEGYGDPPTREQIFQVPQAVGIRETIFHSNPQAAQWNIPSGFYAIKSINGTNDLDFFRVRYVTEGRWAGYTFVDQVVGGKPNHPVKRKDRLFGILTEIKTDVEGAARRYGVELGQCSECNRHLTDEVSRDLGIGPDCRARKYARV